MFFLEWFDILVYINVATLIFKVKCINSTCLPELVDR